MCRTLPGSGPATAGDIMIFAWNMPRVVIETNVRSVFIHFFFKGKEKVSDKQIIPLVEKTLDQKNPRDWYSALFDYGTYLKSTSNPSRRSVHHTTQSAFIGSHRQMRASVLRCILQKPRTKKEIQNMLQYKSETLSRILAELQKEGFIREIKGGSYGVV